MSWFDMRVRSQPADGHLYLAIKREESSRGGSRWLHEHLRLGQTLCVGEPRNLFALEDGEGEVLLIAAGIGITPLLAMHRACRVSGRRVQLHYFARERPSLAFLAELQGQERVYLHAGLERTAVHDQLGALLSSRREEASLYCCGPAGFMQRVREQALEAGWPENALHQEHFQSSAEPLAAGGFELVLAASGQVVQVAVGETLVAAASRVGVTIPTSCGMGMCGCCLTRVIEGTPEHHDDYLGAAEQASGDWILPCVSGCSGTRLVLDQ